MPGQRQVSRQVSVARAQQHRQRARRGGGSRRPHPDQALVHGVQHRGIAVVLAAAATGGVCRMRHGNVCRLLEVSRSAVASMGPGQQSHPFRAHQPSRSGYCVACRCPHMQLTKPVWHLRTRPQERTCQHLLQVLVVEAAASQLLAELADKVGDVQRGAQALHREGGRKVAEGRPRKAQGMAHEAGKARRGNWCVRCTHYIS